jgi:ankyrin repeat protein
VRGFRGSVELPEDVMATKEGESAALDLHALMDAAGRGDVEAIEACLAAGVDSNARARGWLPSFALGVAATKGRVGAIEALLRGGADPDLKGVESWTALMLAAANGHVAATKALAAVADQGVQDRNGHGALAVAASVGAVECVEALMPGTGDARQQAAEMARKEGWAAVVDFLSRYEAMLVDAAGLEAGVPKTRGRGATKRV